MNIDLEKIANVLDAAAAYIDAVESEKNTKVAQERESRITSIAERYNAATGEDVSDDLLGKLANADIDVLTAIEKVADNKQADPLRLGGPGELSDNTAQPTTKKEAADMADDRFLNWILS